MKFVVRVSLEIEIDAENNLSAVEAAEQIIFDGNAGHNAQKYVTRLSCNKREKDGVY